MFAIVEAGRVIAVSAEEPTLSEAGHVLAAGRYFVGLAAPRIVACGREVRRGWTHKAGVFRPPAGAPAAAAATPKPPVHPRRMFEARMRAGLDISSRSAAEICGLYALDDAALARLRRLWLYVGQANAFPADAGHVALRAASGGELRIASVKAFKQVARAIEDYVFECEAQLQASAPVWPPAAVAIP